MTAAGARYNNTILASLPGPELQRLAPHLYPVSFPSGMTLVHGKSSYAYFLEKGVASVLVNMADGRTVEVGIVGCDGIVGMSIVLGAGHAPLNFCVQIAGSGFRIPANTFKAEFERPGALRQRLQNFILAFLVQTTQTAACNRLHNVEERLARRLLTCRDRMSSNRLALTHEFLADMLGSPRTTVTPAVGLLERAGMIKRSRGAITITNRPALEASACECYRIVHAEYVRLNFFSV